MVDLVGDFPGDLPSPDLTPKGGITGFQTTIDSTTDFQDFDFFEIQMTAGVTYRITMNGVGAGALTNPALTLGTREELITLDTDSGVGSNAYIVFTPQITNTYYIGAQSQGPGAGEYRLEAAALNKFAGAAETVFAEVLSHSPELPHSSSGLAVLSQFAQGQFTFGQQIGVFSPTVYMYEALGLALAQAPQFSPALHGFLSPADAADELFVSFVYQFVFGVRPKAEIVQLFVSQLDFFESIYVASGAFGPDITQIQILSRGAVFGQMLGVYANDAANAAFDSGVSIVGVSTTMDFALL
jgi:hypothetical protein